jgi:uncharacterized protein (DUF983 family)
LANRDLLAGILLLAFGAGGLALVAGLDVQSEGVADASDFPRIIAWSIVVMGVAITGQALGSGARMEAWHWRPLCALVAGTLVFSLLIEWAGLLLTAAACAFVGSLAAPFPSWKHRVAVALVICIIAVVLFSYVLGLPIAVWPA